VGPPAAQRLDRERGGVMRLSRGPWKLRWGSSVWSGSCETLRQTVPRI
jgi:hypothetical protein